MAGTDIVSDPEICQAELVEARLRQAQPDSSLSKFSSKLKTIKVKIIDYHVSFR